MRTYAVGSSGPWLLGAELKGSYVVLRIRTNLQNGRVFTLLFQGKWITIFHSGSKSGSVDAATLHEAGQNHLNYCLQLQREAEHHGERT